MQDQSPFYIWRKFYLWSSLTYFAGATAAGLIVKIIISYGFYALVATLPIIVVIYCTYKTYLKNIETMALQAEQAQRHVEELSRYIKERQKAEEERDQLLIREQEARREAEAANRMKDEFLATVSHELRTPITAILGWSHMLLSLQLNESKQLHAIEVIGRNAKMQVQLIDDLLDVSRIITGKLRVEMYPVNLSNVIKAAIESVQTAATARLINIESHTDPSIKHVAGDPERLQQVIWNLLSNAIKFTPQGGTVKVHVEYSDSHARVVVSDTGHGISPEFLPYVFDRFRQADSSITRSHGGLGLGLAIVRHLVELHGGHVYAESAGLGQGTTMYVELPLMQAQSQSSTLMDNVIDIRHGMKNTQVLAGIHVLVVEDNTDTLDLLRTILINYGAVVTSATSALDALRLFDRSQPDIILSDISMPGKDGYEMIKAIRSLPDERGGNIPAISISAFVRDEDRKRALDAGFNRCLPKPVIADDLVSCISSLLESSKGLIVSNVS
jgi:signal transduction histidine kinase/CheY-like chemotaxis protein